ncbi:MAG: hypothetical protein QOH72_5057 [Solirubrobacteraceae bacterium]|jgi:hypothetical protein|nr:hypothetical protein [Solirubrobacteraceae bacterium]
MTTPSPRPLAVVTGASSGIGLELAKQFAGNGFDLLVAAEDAELADAAAELRGYGATVEALRVDLPPTRASTSSTGGSPPPAGPSTRSPSTPASAPAAPSQPTPTCMTSSG